MICDDYGRQIKKLLFAILVAMFVFNEIGKNKNKLRFNAECI